MTPAVLVVEDRRSLAEVLAVALTRAGFRPQVEFRGDLAVERLASGEVFLAVITDLKLPGADGLAVLEAARRSDPTLPVLLITAHATVDTAVAALKLGAREYFTKPLDMDRLLAALAAVAEPRQALLEGPASGDLPELVGQAPAFREVVAALRRVAPTEAAVLLTGPSGTGKELFAQAVHRLSRRAAGPFVAFNCAAVPETLVETELFGHERGAFTGATGRHVGRFEQAQKGTLFLDEIGDVPLNTQAKLLRALEERRIARLGGSGEVAVDVRFVAATNRDLAAATAQGAFRQDLFHRLNVFPIALPALTQRREDIPALTLHFLERAAQRHGVPAPAVQPAAMALLTLAPWPGNVRELANLLERSVILAAGQDLEPRWMGLDLAECRLALADPATRELARRLAGDQWPALLSVLGVQP